MDLFVPETPCFLYMLAPPEVETSSVIAYRGHLTLRWGLVILPTPSLMTQLLLVKLAIVIYTFQCGGNLPYNMSLEVTQT